MNIGGSGSIGITPELGPTWLIFDEPEYIVTEQPVCITRGADRIALGGEDQRLNMQLIPFVGWRIRILQDSLENIGERKRGQATIKAPNGVDVATDYSPFAGELVDDPFELPVLPFINVGVPRHIVVTWHGHLPSGTSVGIQLYDTDGNVCTTFASGNLTTASAGGLEGGYASFVPIAGQAAYVCQYSLTANSSKGSSPTIQQVSYTRATASASSGTTPFTVQWPPADLGDAPEGMSPPDALVRQGLVVTGMTKGGQDEALSCVVADFAAKYPKLRQRGWMRVQLFVQTDVDADHPACEFDGYVVKPSSARRGAMDSQPQAVGAVIKDVNPDWRASGDTGYPNPAWGDTHVQAGGAWQKLAWANAPERLSFSYVTEMVELLHGLGVGGGDYPFQAPKATDMIREVLLMAGIQPSEMDIPNFGQRMDPKKTASDLAVIKKGVGLWAWLQKACEDYLGMFIYKDLCRFTNYWRLMLPAVTPLSPIMAFVPDGTNQVTGVAPVGRKGSYGPLTVPAGYRNAGASIPVVPIIKTIQPATFPVPPELNLAEVTTTGDRTTLGGDAFLNKTSWAVFNPASFNAFGVATADENSVDYLGGLKAGVRNSPEYDGDGIPQMITRRVLDVQGHGYYHFAYESPAAYVTQTQTGDSLQVRPRRPRYYDAVLIWDSLLQIWVPWLVLCCSLNARASFHSKMQMEVRSLPDLNNIADYPNLSSAIRAKTIIQHV